MDHRPLSGAAPSWRLAPPHDKQTQGLVVSGFSDLPTGRALFLEFGWIGIKKGGGGDWLKSLSGVSPITDGDGKDPRCAAIGLTWWGLKRMGLDANALESFDLPFKEGMFQEDRLRRLGDRRNAIWQPTVIEGGPQWSGNTPLDEASHDTRPGAFREEGVGTRERQAETPITVHAVVLLYEQNDQRADAWCAAVEAALKPHAVFVVHRLPLNLRPDAHGIPREHFGFADGISQPLPFEQRVVTLSTGGSAPIDPWHGVPLGEILMGHLNGLQEVAAGPVVADTSQGRAAGLQPHPRGVGFLDLGMDGSYMVVRELKQDVAQFWHSMDEGAKELSLSQQAGGMPVTADWIASRVVGRELDGNLPCPGGGVLPPNNYGQPENDFGFYERDRWGLGCPLGSHVRRGNPRDGLAPAPGFRQTMLDAAKNHRILRRGRKFGTDIADPRIDDKVNRGLLFICFNTDVARQFEFVQQTWILNPNFALLFDETDPLIGPSPNFTIPDDPLRRIVPVSTFVQMAGGEYFFLPSIPALRYLESL